MEDRIRLGIVGTSNWTELIYLKNLANDPEVELAAICGRNTERAGQLAAQYQIGRTFSDYRELIEKGNLDAVIVATPDDQHLAMTLAAIDAGLHVLCEKPLANNTADARRMLDAAEAARIKHMVMFTWRWQPHFQYVKSLIEEGAFGDIFRVKFAFITNFSQDGKYQWRLDPGRANGVVADLGSHMIDLGRWMFGEVASVSADLGTAVSRKSIAGHEGGSGPDIAHMAMRFDQGAQFVIDITSVSEMGDGLMKHVMRIEAAKASLELEHVFLGELAGTTLRWFGTGEERSRLLNVPQQYFGSSDRANFLDIYRTEPVGARGFVAAIRDGKVPSPNFRDGWRAQRVVDAAILSSHQRRWIEIEPEFI